MWWSTAWPKTRSKLESSNGSISASARTVRTLTPSRQALALSASSIPGEMSVAVEWRISPDWSRLSEK